MRNRKVLTTLLLALGLPLTPMLLVAQESTIEPLGTAIQESRTLVDFNPTVMPAQTTYAHLVNSVRFRYGGRNQLPGLTGNELQRNASSAWAQALNSAWAAIHLEDARTGDSHWRDDVSQWLVSGVLGTATGAFNHSLSLYAGTEEPSNTRRHDHAQDFYGVAFSEQFQLLPGHTPYFRISFHFSENKGLMLVPGNAREADMFSTSFGWIWRANPNINVTTDLTYTENDNNLDSVTYDRVKFQTGLRYQF
ncbi:MAG TPA: hypothetical protein GX696_04875 [Pseudomonadaceae bacterium]|nr:hypothetical protein [Pseudomonadaceae bacterium]